MGALLHTYKLDKTWLCALIFLFLLTICEIKAYRCERLRGIHGSCYIFIRTPVTWEEAVFDCRNRKHGDIVTLEMRREAMAVQRALLKDHDQLVFYVEDKRQIHQSQSRNRGSAGVPSTLGALLTWRRRRYPEITGARRDSCTAFDFRPGHRGQLIECSCEEKHGYICEVPTKGDRLTDKINAPSKDDSFRDNVPSPDDEGRSKKWVKRVTTQRPHVLMNHLFG